MAKNSYLAKVEADRRGFFRAGLETGRQQIIDMFCLVLHDPEIMGKDTFGKDRILKVLDAVSEKLDYFDPAFSTTDETDYYQEQMDRLMAEILGVDVKDLQFPFNDRYPHCLQYDYKKGRWTK